jgi:hypothetical protein
VTLFASRVQGMKRLKLHEEFAYRIGRYDIGMNEMAALAGIGQSTLYALQNPETHGTRTGGMHPKTAAKIIHAFCERTGLSDEEARKLLLVEMDEPRRPRRKKTNSTDETAI